MTWSTATHWIGEFYSSYAASYMLRNITYGTFLFFGTMTVLSGAFVWFFVPETSGVALEDMDVLFEAKGFARQQMRAYKEWKLAQTTLLADKVDDGQTDPAHVSEKHEAVTSVEQRV
jgi:hypothetical protein